MTTQTPLPGDLPDKGVLYNIKTAAPVSERANAAVFIYSKPVTGCNLRKIEPCDFL